MNWISIRFLLIVAQILDLDTQAINFVLALLQAGLDMPVGIELQAGIDLEEKGENSLHQVLRLSKSLDGVKQGSHKCPVNQLERETANRVTSTSL